MKRCYVCTQEGVDTRPLGEGGQDICLTCMTQPEWRTMTANNLGAVVYATSMISPTGMVTIDGEDIRPMRPDDVWTTPQGNS